MTTYLSEHFTLEELTVSAAATRKGLHNNPPLVELANLKATARQMEEVRTLLGHPVLVLSGYRSPAVNRLVKGSRTSAHMSGHAVDFICPGFGSAPQVASFLAAHLTSYDQIIDEFGEWVHVGFGPGLRLQKLTARRVGGKTRYTPGITA
jgi:hypothetical protein